MLYLEWQPHIVMQNLFCGWGGGSRLPDLRERWGCHFWSDQRSWYSYTNIEQAETDM